MCVVGSSMGRKEMEGQYFFKMKTMTDLFVVFPQLYNKKRDK